MRTSQFVWAGALSLNILATMAATPLELAPAAPLQDMVLWYRQPAVKWIESLPMGNGHLGARVFGNPRQERIALNESTFWSGRPHDYDDPESNKHYARIRELISAGEFQEAEKLVNARFYGRPAAQQAFQPLGDLLLGFEGDEPVEDYRRELDMERGVAKITYRAGGVGFTREVFVSYPDRVLVVRISADKPGRVSLQAQLKSPYLNHLTAGPGKLVMDGCWKGPIPVSNWLIAPVAGEGLRFQTVLSAIPEGGLVDATDSTLRIRTADAVTLILTAATSYVNYHDISGDPAAACGRILAAAAGKDYPTLLKRHKADFCELMGRVHLKVGDPSQARQATDERLKAVRDGAADPNLEALCFQFGR